MGDTEIHTACGVDLDAIAADFGVERKAIRCGDRAELETDAQLRARILTRGRGIGRVREQADALASAEGQAMEAAVALLLGRGAALHELELVHEIGQRPDDALTIIRRCYVRLRERAAPVAAPDPDVRQHRAAIASRLREAAARSGMHSVRYDQGGMGATSNVGEILDRWADAIERGTFGIPAESELVALCMQPGCTEPGRPAGGSGGMRWCAAHGPNGTEDVARRQAPAIATPMGPVRACSKPITWRGTTRPCEEPAGHEGGCVATFGSTTYTPGPILPPPGRATIAVRIGGQTVEGILENGNVSIPLPLRGSAELHAELAPPPGTAERVAQRVGGRRELEVTKDGEDGVTIALRGRVVCRLLAVLHVPPDNLAAADRIPREVTAALRILPVELPPAGLLASAALAASPRSPEGEPAIDTRPEALAAEVAAQDRQIAELSERLARLELQRETLLAALGRVAGDLQDHASAWKGLGGLDRLTTNVARGWGEHAERAATRVAWTVAKVRAGEG